jgi:RNA polymerase sigma factor (sigma-70 family)
MSLHDEFTTTPAWDEHWVERLKALESAAWDDLMKFYSDDLRADIEKSLRKRGLPLDWAADVEQDTWLTAVRKIEKFQGDLVENLYHWLRVVALNHIRMTTRRQKLATISLDQIEAQETVTGISLDHFLYEHGMSDPTPEQALLHQERLMALELAVRELSPREQEILLRHMFDNLKPRELAVIYGIEARSVSTVLRRAKQNVERHMAAQKFFKREGL